MKKNSIILSTIICSGIVINTHCMEKSENQNRKKRSFTAFSEQQKESKLLSLSARARSLGISMDTITTDGTSEESLVERLERRIRQKEDEIR